MDVTEDGACGLRQKAMQEVRQMILHVTQIKAIP
jgi:hypothetical protein